MAASFLEGTGVSKSFGGLRVLNEVGFRVAEGEIVGLIGPNGAGKTTLFNVISGLERPSAGAIRVGDRRVDALPAHRVARLGVARTFQTPRPFLDLTALENVRMAALFGERAAPAGPTALLGLVELEAQGGIRARHLPGPHRKLLELAMALAQGPRLVLLDEILAGLTPTEVGRATAILRRIRDEHGIGLFWIEHVMQAVMAAAERVIVLDHGEVIAEGAPRTVVRDARVLEAYLGKSMARSH
ncbi:MAG TPA: ABC transporter ATP-binding protein [Methylomirabilota bacterium]|jgi:branched-chain amino acid transport system ATP-binding protein|nr:ABC transporter ATP-binding protein [Methylomirabilota bacterium]